MPLRQREEVQAVLRTDCVMQLGARASEPVLAFLALAKEAALRMRE